jgi:DNA modification methylase
MSDWEVIQGDCLDAMPNIPENSIDAIVTDPPYGLAFMGKAWDHAVPGPEFFAAMLRVAKPGAHLVAFGGTRLYHRMTVAIEDAGWEVRDSLMWLYGSGFPKSHDVSKAIDKRGGADVGWFGPWFRVWREENSITQKQVAALFPSKTGGLTGCVANWELGFNVPTPDQFNLIRDTFSLPFESIEEAEREVVGHQRQGRLAVAPGQHNDRSMTTLDVTAPATDDAKRWQGWGTALKPAWEPIVLARKPLDGTVAQNHLRHGCGGLNVDGCRVAGDDHAKAWDKPVSTNISAGAYVRPESRHTVDLSAYRPSGRWPANLILGEGVTDAEWSRFFYCPKASKRDRDENNTHPTVKPTDLMRYLCRLITPQGGTVLDPFTGSGSTGKAAILEGFNFIGIERDTEYVNIAKARIAEAQTKETLNV